MKRFLLLLFIYLSIIDTNAYVKHVYLKLGERWVTSGAWGGGGEYNSNMTGGEFCENGPLVTEKWSAY